MSTALRDDVKAYAALEARVAARPADRSAVFAEAGLDVYAMARLRAQWDARFAEDEILREAYEQHLDAAAADAPRPAPRAEAAPAAPLPSYLQHPAAAPPAPAPAPAPYNPDETLPVGSAAAVGDMLPFRAEPSLAFEAEIAARRATAAAAASLAPTPAPLDQGPAEEDEPGSTLAVNIAAVLSAAEALPFKLAAPDDVPAWTPAQYASLGVELELYPDRAATLRRYGLADEAAHARLVRAWEDKERRAPGLRPRLDTLAAEYRAQLTRRR